MARIIVTTDPTTQHDAPVLLEESVNSRGKRQRGGPVVSAEDAAVIDVAELTVKLPALVEPNDPSGVGAGDGH